MEATTVAKEGMEMPSPENKGEREDETLIHSPTGLLWSGILSSPTNGDQFSPSRDLGDKDCLHGLGLQKALDHGKLVARGGRRCASMLLEAASCYEQFGVALMKACQSNPLEGDTFKSLLSLSQRTRQLSALLREDIALPLQGYHKNMGETVPAIYQKYEQSRRRAHEARQRALVVRFKYLKAVQDAEQACREVQKAASDLEQTSPSKEGSEEANQSNSQETVTGTKSVWVQQLEQYAKTNGRAAADRVTLLLNDVTVLQKRYASCVEKENKAVMFSQTIESIALDGLQKLQEQRLCAFYDSLQRTFQALKNALDNLTIADESNVDESSVEQVKIVQNKKGEFFSTFLKGGGQEKTGLADADTLGLTDDVGSLRDEVQTRIAERLARFRKVKALVAFFEELSSAAAKLGNGLQQLVKLEDSYVSSNGTPVEHLRTLLSNNEGPRTLSTWNALLKTLQREAESFNQFTRAIESIKTSKLDSFCSTGEKQIKEASEQDDALWKNLCEAARTVMRADAKYKQNTAQTAKARERVRSVDMEKAAEKGSKSPQKVNRAMDGMNKAFGNFLSILPDGGEQAMQILTPDARRAVAERAAKEADEKEMKGRQALENAVTYKIKAMASYKSRAEALTKQYELDEISGAEDIKAATESLGACSKNLQSSRNEALGDSLESHSLESVLADLDKWVDSTLRGIKARSDLESVDETSPGGGFMLRVVLPESDKVLKVACIEKSDTFESECSEKEQIDENSAADLLDGSHSMAMNMGPDVLKNEDEATKDNVTLGNRWLQKSMSTPIGKPGFKAFRKFHSMGDDAENVDDTTETSMVSTTVPTQNSKEMLNTDVFLTFWPDYEGTPPFVTCVFSCAFLPRDCVRKNLSSVEHGCLFLTQLGAVFVAWRGRKALVQYSSMTAVEKIPSIYIPAADDTLLITAQGSASVSTLSLGCFCAGRRDETFQLLEDRIEKATKARAEAEAANNDIPSDSNLNKVSSPPVPPDLVLTKMETVLSKKVRGILVSKFHEIVWSDTAADDSLYGRWLASGGKCFDINVGAWETPAGGITGTWCGEIYSHTRKVNFQLKRTSRIGPPVAGVTQTQYCRVDDNNRSVMHMTVAFTGIPYADTFQVEVRWVATRSGTKDLTVQVGVDVNFLKSTLLKSQIKSGTLSETKPVHESLFAFVNSALSKEVITEETEGNEADENSDDGSNRHEHEKATETANRNIASVVMENLHFAGPALAVVVVFFLWWPAGSGTNSEIASLHAKMEDMQSEMKLMRQAIEQLTLAMKEQVANREKAI